MRNLKEIAKENGLEVINVGTSYGVKESEAIVGFESLEEAQELADKEGMNVCVFKNKNNTSSCFTKECENPYQEFNNIETYSDYTIFRNTDAENFQEIDIDETLDSKEFANDKERKAWLKEMNEIKNCIASLADDEFIYLDNNGEYSEPLKEKAMSTVGTSGDFYIIGVSL